VEIRNIVVPVDFSEHSKKALAFAIMLAKQSEATIHLVHGMHLPPDVRMTGDWWATLRAQAISGLDSMIDEIEKAGVKSELHLEDEHPVAAILKLAEELDADLITMGTRGLTGAKHVVLGSVAERTIRLARCPVLSVKADAG
jgi:nucleotide-binding universal stress UspA family protein